MKKKDYVLSFPHSLKESRDNNANMNRALRSPFVIDAYASEYPEYLFMRALLNQRKEKTKRIEFSVYYKGKLSRICIRGKLNLSYI